MFQWTTEDTSNCPPQNPSPIPHSTTCGNQPWCPQGTPRVSCGRWFSCQPLLFPGNQRKLNSKAHTHHLHVGHEAEQCERQLNSLLLSRPDQTNLATSQERVHHSVRFDTRCFGGKVFGTRSKCTKDVVSVALPEHVKKCTCPGGMVKIFLRKRGQMEVRVLAVRRNTVPLQRRNTSSPAQTQLL